MKPKKLKLNGKSHTFREWSRILGIAEITLRNRIRAGWSVRETLSTPLDTKKNTKTYPPRQYTCGGKSMTLAQWSRHTGIPYYVLVDRMQKLDRWSVEKALTTPVHEMRSYKKYSFNGKTLSLREWSKETGVSTTVLYARIRRNLPPAKVFDPKVGKPWGSKVHNITFNGRTLPIYGWSKVTGISRQVLTNRFLSGVRPPELFEKPVRTKLKLYTINGVTKSIYGWAKKTGLDPHTIRARLKRGLTIEQSLANVNYRCKEYRQ